VCSVVSCRGLWCVLECSALCVCYVKMDHGILSYTLP
jgi:hypothetical protein